MFALHHQVVSTEQGRIMFSFDLAEEWLKTQNLPCFSMDLCGRQMSMVSCWARLVRLGWKRARMESLTFVFVLLFFFCPIAASQEVCGDVEASGCQLDAWLFDCHCYNGAIAALDSDESMRRSGFTGASSTARKICERKGARKIPSAVKPSSAMIFLCNKAIVKTKNFGEIFHPEN